MDFLNRFRKKKEMVPKKESVPEKKEIPETELEKVCADDPEAYEALFDTMLINLRSIGITLEEAVKKAKKLEAEGNTSGAYNAYSMAGSLALREGTLEQVKEYFGACARLIPQKKLKILEVPERAFKKAQEYYRQIRGREAQRKRGKDY